MSFEILNPLEYAGWDDLIKTNPAASFFHSSYWSRVLKDTYHYKPLYFVSKDEDELKCLVPMMEIDSILTGRRGVSLPFSDYCEPIISGGKCFEEVIKSIIDYGRQAKWRYFELRSIGDLPIEAPCFCHYHGHSLQLLKDTKSLYSHFKRTIKQNIKKAQRNELQVQENNSYESVKDFYRLNCLTRKRHGLPPQPFSFFKSISENIFKKGHGFVLLVDYNHTKIAGGMFFHFGDKAIYKYSAMDKKYQYLRPNDLITWKAIERYGEAGNKKFCFGRTETDNEGLRRFKAGWGGEESVIKYYRYSFAENDFVEGFQGNRTPVALFKMMPTPLLKLIGTILYKYIG